jgi:hypothetical protein
MRPQRFLQEPRLLEVHAAVFPLAVLDGMEVLASLALRLVLLDRDAVLLGPGVLADARDLPGDLGPRGAGADVEGVPAIFLTILAWTKPASSASSRTVNWTGSRGRGDGRS